MASVVQVVESSVGNTNGQTISVNITVTAGNALIVYAAWDPTNPGTLQSVTDTLNGAVYGNALDTALDAANQNDAQFLFPNTKGGANTVTASFTQVETFIGIAVVEVTGVGSNPLDGHTGQNQATPGTGADGVTSGNANSTATNTFLVGLGVEVASTNVTNAGTGFTNNAAIWDFATGTKQGRVESLTLSASGNHAATFTAVANDSHNSLVMLLDIAPVITTQPASQTVLLPSGSTATFTVVATASSGSLSYQWKQNGSNVGTNSSSFTTSALTLANNKDIYTVVVSDSNGSTTSNAAILTVLACPPVGWLKA